MQITVKIFGESTILIEWKQEITTRNFLEISFLHKSLPSTFTAIIESIPSFASLALIVDSDVVNLEELIVKLKKKIDELCSEIRSENQIESLNSAIKRVPICFHPEFALDLDEIAATNNTERQAVIDLYLQGTYRVHLLGFLPGFVYLGGLNEQLYINRKEIPRKIVPKGSVAIGGEQTGIYPAESPGGWQIIGKTPLDLFDPTRVKPSLFEVGDCIQFYEISKEEIENQKKLEKYTTNQKVPFPDKKWPSIKVLRAGLLTSIQDQGRVGQRHLGIPMSGAMDNESAELANLLLGNHQDCPLLEITLLGPRLLFSHPTLITLTGAESQAKINEKPITNNSVLRIVAGDLLEIGRLKSGCRAYLAVKGGFDAPKVLGSTSYCSTADFGVQAMVVGDYVGYRQYISTGLPTAQVRFTRNFDRPIRLSPGPEFHLLSEELIVDFFRHPYHVSLNANRMALPLEGKALKLPAKKMLSSAVLPGTIQLPPSGFPIILMADCQTIGGYPRIFQVLEADMGRLGQACPKGKLAFKMV